MSNSFIGQAGAALLSPNATNELAKRTSAAGSGAKVPGSPTLDAPSNAIYISFFGEDLNGGGNVQRFQAMVGDNAPTITDGYGQWSVVDRPLMRSVTIFQGYKPAQMKVELRFGVWTADGWRIGTEAGQITERNILALDMMAGSAGHYFAGPPQVVYLAAATTNGAMSNLIPPQYQYTPYSGTKLFPWVVNGLEWGQAYRNADGYRVYQEATVTLLQYVNAYGLPAAPSVTGTTTGGWFIATKARNTPLLIAAAPSVNSPRVDHEALAHGIVNAKQNRNLKLRSIKQKIAPTKQVWIPSHVVNH